MKSIFGNAFPYLRVFGCAQKMHFSEMLFNWPLNGCKLIFVSILPSNSYFPENRERAEGEGDAPAHRERERERERGRRERGRLVHRPTSNPFDFAVRLRPLTSPFDFTFAPITIAVAAPIRRPRSRTQIRRTPKLIVLDPKTDRPPSLLLSI